MCRRIAFEIDRIMIVLVLSWAMVLTVVTPQRNSKLVGHYEMYTKVTENYEDEIKSTMETNNMATTGVQNMKGKDKESSEESIPASTPTTDNEIVNIPVSEDNESEFSLLDAVRKGFQFQSEFCPFSCNGASVDTSPCLFSKPICDPCSCHDDCHRYRDCCEPNMCPLKTTNDTDSFQGHVSKILDKPVKFLCFQHNELEGVKIIASCPDVKKGQPAMNSIHLSKHQHRCARCQTSFTTQSLLTSVRTGFTYCNMACLLCNEPSTRGTGRQVTVWRKEKFCTVIMNTSNSTDSIFNDGAIDIRHCKETSGPSNCSERFGQENSANATNTKRDTGYDSILVARNDLETSYSNEDDSVYESSVQDNSANADSVSIVEICKPKFFPPSSVNVHHCFPAGNHEKVVDCDPGVLPTSLDQDTRVRLIHLCRDGYTWPVYTEDRVWYKNIFCFLCQNQTPLPCTGPSHSHDGPLQLPSHKFILGTLTDIHGYSDDYFKGNEQEEEEYLDSSGNLTRDGVMPSERLARFECPDGFWDNFITNKCVPARCSKGRHLQTVRDGDNNMMFKCVFSMEEEVEGKKTEGVFIEEEEKRDEERERKDKEGEGEDEFIANERRSMDVVYVLNLWWVWNGSVSVDEDDSGLNNESDITSCDDDDDDDSTATPCHHHHHDKNNDDNGHHVILTLRKENIDFGVGSIDNSPSHLDSKAKQDNDYHNINYESINQNKPSLNRDLPGTKIYNSDKEYQRQPGLHGKHLKWDAETSDSNGNYIIPQSPYYEYTIATLKDETKSIERALTTDTISKLFDFNITYFLLSTATGHTEDDTNDESFKIDVYLPLNNSAKKGMFEDMMIKAFTANVTINLKGRAFQFQTILSSLRSRAKIIFTKEQFYTCNKTAPRCCSQVDAREHSFQAHQTWYPSSNSPRIRLNIVSGCPYIALNATLLNETDDFRLVYNELPFSLEQYEFENSNSGKIFVCVDTLNKIRERFIHAVHFQIFDRYMWWESLMTVTFLPLSMICLALTFITYCVFPILRTKPGQNNMCLIVCLFIAQGLTLLNPLVHRQSDLCMVIGMALHYFWLSAMAWMCACSFHMFQVFVVQRAALRSCKSHRWYLLRYTIFCHGLPAILVIVVAAVSHHYSHDHFGYGGRTCYLYPGLLVGLAFVLPQALILLVNSVLFIITVVTISRVDDIKRQAGRERNNVHIYLSLSSLTGLTWILALLSQIPGMGFTRFLSVITNGGQGLTIFLCYVCNPRVRIMWSGLVNSRKRAQTATYARGTSSTSKSGTLSYSV